jgi:hypothetical protein
VTGVGLDPAVTMPVPVVTQAAAGSALSIDLSGPSPAGLDAGELVRRWLLGKRSEQTRRAYGRDLQLWLAWCEQLGANPLTVQRAGLETVGVSRSHVEAWARMLEAGWSAGGDRGPADLRGVVLV